MPPLGRRCTFAVCLMQETIFFLLPENNVSPPKPLSTMFPGTLHFRNYNFLLQALDSMLKYQQNIRAISSIVMLDEIKAKIHLSLSSIITHEFMFSSMNTICKFGINVRMNIHFYNSSTIIERNGSLECQLQMSNVMS